MLTTVRCTTLSTTPSMITITITTTNTLMRVNSRSIQSTQSTKTTSTKESPQLSYFNRVSLELKLQDFLFRLLLQNAVCTTLFRVLM